MSNNTPADFTRWWLAYPRKVGKQLASTQWSYTVRRITADKSISYQEATDWLLERTTLFANSDIGLRGGKYCPYPAKWLSDGRFDDDIDEWNDTGLSDKSQRSLDNIGKWLEGKQ